MKEDFRRLQQVMSQPSPSDQEVKAILTDIKRKKKAGDAEPAAAQGEEEEALLTPVQQARYIMYLQTLGKEARSVKGGPGDRPGAPGAPGVSGFPAWVGHGAMRVPTWSKRSRFPISNPAKPDEERGDAWPPFI